jgi:ribosomal protein S18 acetylase RimI-like enzyme
MDIKIREVTEEDLQVLLILTVLAFEPIFESFKEILGPSIFAMLYPDWQETQRKIVLDAMHDEKIHFWVAEVHKKVVGLITYILNHENKHGEVHFLAVHPDYQNIGIGTALNMFVLEKFKQAGMILAEVGTGGDESHAPARKAYEKAGYVSLPLVRYYKGVE